MNKKIKKNYIPSYNLGGWFKDHPLDWARKNASTVGTTTGAIAGGILGSVIPGAGTALGASLGSALGGSLGGAVQSNYDNNAEAERANKLRLEQDKLMQPMLANLSPKSMYGIYAKGGNLEGEENPIINIEEGELAVQKPKFNSRAGKIVKEFTGKNPLTGTNFQPHSSKKQKEPVANYVPTEMVKDELQANYIISKKYAKAYKDATRRKDQFTINSILRNIDAESEMGIDKRNIQMKKGGAIPKYQLGGGFDLRQPRTGFEPDFSILTGNRYNTLQDIAPRGPELMKMSLLQPTTSPINLGGLRGLSTLPEQISSEATTNLFGDSTYSGLNRNAMLASIPGAINLLRGAFEKPFKNKNVDPIFNPYESQALSKFSGRLSSQPAINELNNQRNAGVSALKANTPNASIYRSNVQNLFGNAGKNVGNIVNQTRQTNLGLDAQEGNAIMNAGNARVGARENARNMNFQIDQMNLQNRAAKENLLYSGIADIPKQLLQLEQNKQLQDMEAFKAMMLMDTFGTSKDMLTQPKYAKYRKLLGI